MSYNLVIDDHNRIKTSRTVRRFFGAVLLSFLVSVGLGAQTALAHNSLDGSVPAEGAILDQAPNVWALLFSKDVPLDSASAEIINGDGVRTELAPPTYGTSNKEIVFTLPAGLTGNVTGRWRLVGTDGHVISARVGFSIAAPPVTEAPVVVVPETTTAPDVVVTSTVPVVAEVTTIPVVADVTTIPVDRFEETRAPEPIRLGVRAVGYLALLLVGGLLFTDFFIARNILGAGRARDAFLGGSIILAVAPLLQTMIFLDDSREFGVFGSLFHIFEAFDTTPGAMLLVRSLAGFTLLAGLLILPKKSPTTLASPTMLAAGGAYLTALAYAGHSRSMAWPVLGIPVDIVHTGAAVVWLGGLAIFVLFVIPTLTAVQSFEAFRRFGDAARVAVIAMVVTGVIQTLRLHGTIVTLFSENHGRWLLLKLALVALMLKIGDINRRRLLRRLPVNEAAYESRVALLRRASLTEIANGALVILVTAILVTSSFN